MNPRTVRILEPSGNRSESECDVKALPTGRYMKMPTDKIADGDFSKEWFVDERERPESVSV